MHTIQPQNDTNLLLCAGLHGGRVRQNMCGGKGKQLHKLGSLCHLSVACAGEFHVGFWRQSAWRLAHNVSSI